MAPTSVARAGRGILKGLLLLVCLAGTAWAQRGAITVHRNLGELTDQAAMIVRGRVVEAHVEKHPEFTNLNTVVVTLKVSETLKGRPGRTLTFRQFIWDFRDRQDAAGYSKGQEYLLLMNAPNEHGLSSPAGLDQGRFRIVRDREGREIAVNGAGNYGLFRGLQAHTTKRGISLSPRMAALAGKQRAPLAADDLRQLILELQGQQGQ